MNGTPIDASPSERNADIMDRFRAGDTLQSIGDHHGITREAVRLISLVWATGDDEQQRRAAIHARIHARSSTGRAKDWPAAERDTLERKHASLAGIADETGLPTAALRAAGWSARGLIDRPLSARPNNVTNYLQRLEALFREYMTTPGASPTLKDFAAWANETGTDRRTYVSMQVTIRSSGVSPSQWISALGYDVHVTPLRADAAKADECVDALKRFLADTQPRRLTIARYEAWRKRGNPGPCRATIQRTLGTTAWSQIIEIAQDAGRVHLTRVP